jgi:class 3 adenylate cyclase
MSSLPLGTVTFLFTDIEGSTKLAQQNSDKWETLRERHHAILNSAIETHSGYVFQIIGDAFCAAFHNVYDGLSTAIQAQQKLQIENWGDASIRVRMGLCAFFGAYSELWWFSVPNPFSSQPLVTQTIRPFLDGRQK